MRLRALLPLTLLLLLATQMSFAQPKTESGTSSADSYGIDLTGSYTGSQVADLIQILEQEAEAAIDRAFDEGYKQGLLAAAPEAAYWKARCDELSASLSAETEKARKQKWLFALGGFGAGFLTGGGIGLTVRLPP